MTKRIPQSGQELEEHLSDQLQFLESSCAAYDAGFKGDAKRLAASLRLLLHNTKRSHSPLQQLGRLTIDYYNTSRPIFPGNLFNHAGLIMTRIGPGAGEGELRPKLDDAPELVRLTPYGKWWNEGVIAILPLHILSRRDLVLYVADQDGGAHVDPALDEVYSNLSRRNSLGWAIENDGKKVQLDGPERPSIRQIAHEVLKTLKPGYEAHNPDIIPQPKG